MSRQGRRRGARGTARRGRSRRGRSWDPWLDLEWEEDELARRIVEAEPDGLTLDEIGAHLGLTRERVRQIEQGALRKLQAPSLGHDVAILDGWAFAVPACLDCGALFVRLSGRQEICGPCSAARRDATPRGRHRDHVWEPTPAGEAVRRLMSVARSVDAAILARKRGLPARRRVALVGPDGVRYRIRRG